MSSFASPTATVKHHAASGVIVKMYVDTTPGRRWEVGRELLGRIKRACDSEGISISVGR